MQKESKILHIFDDEIICRSTIELYKKLDQLDQKFIIISNSPEKWSHYFPNDSSVSIIPISENTHVRITEEIEHFEIIILQAFSVTKAKSILKKKFIDKIFIWALWGYGLYNIVNYFKPSDSELSTTLTKKNLKQRLQDFYTYRIVYRRALKKINLCVFLLEHDFNLLSQAVKHDAIWMTACYQTEENLFGQMGKFDVVGNDILIGNSSTPSNRHQFVFDKLASAELGDSRLITPLGYGDQTYKQRIIDSGRATFGKQFSPIVDFMELDAYQAMLSSCGHVIMAHERQQAFGTLLMMLLAGSKIYLSEKSPFFNWFTNMGVTLYSIEKDLITEIKQPIDKQLRIRNKLLIQEYLGMPKRLAAITTFLSRAQEFQLNKAG
ncbi:MAG: dTDP-N-acetylfucosamine:lipid II N-acetylfucosaminyltransferase [Flavobacteriaceae bacterium]|jgi:dTDP-N-acetylfucosamine:lipid II N-acetylfucosaminyltransferase